MKCKNCDNTSPPLNGFPNKVFCNYYHLHMSNLSSADRCEHFKPKPKTNADRIRAMSDEELCDKFIFGDAVNPCPDIGRTETCYKGKDCRECWLDWLKQEVKE